MSPRTAPAVLLLLLVILQNSAVRLPRDPAADSTEHLNSVVNVPTEVTSPSGELYSPESVGSGKGSGILVQKLWGGTSSSSANSVAVDSTGNIYVTGSTNSFGPGSPSHSALALLKYSRTGSLLWQRIWSGGGNGNETGNRVAVDSSGNIYVTGSTTSFGGGKEDVLLLKFDPSGNLVWQKTWGGSQVDKGDGVAVDSAGDIYVSGYTTNAFSVAVLLLKFDSSGNLLWEKSWGRGQGTDVAVDSTGDVYVAGGDSTNAVVGLLLKINSSGAPIWQRSWSGRSYNTGHFDVAQGITVDSKGNVYVTGYTQNCQCITFGSNVAVLKFNSTGGMVWQKQWAGEGVDQGLGIAADLSGSIYVTGFTTTYGYGGRSPLFDSVGHHILNENVFLLHLDSSGNPLQVFTYGAIPCSDSGCTFDSGSSVAIDSFGGPIMVGQVGENPPYVGCETDKCSSPYPLRSLSGGNATIMTSSFDLINPRITDTTSTGSLRLPTGIAGTPLGNETYAGSYDMFILEASPLYVITFKTSPTQASDLGITFNGTHYPNAETGVYYDMVTTANAELYSGIAGGLGISFSRWVAEGGVSVTGPTDNPTTVTVHGPGSLLAEYTYNPTPSQSPFLKTLLTFVLAATAILSVLIIAVIASVIRKRKRVSSISPPPSSLSIPPADLMPPMRL